MGAVVIRVAVDRVVSQRDWGALFSGPAADGRRAIVRSSEPLWPVPGEVYDVEGEETAWTDRWGRDHRQIEASRLARVRASGRLLQPWLTALPGIGEDRAKRLLARFGRDLLDVLEDPSQAGEIARALDPSRPALAERLAALLQARYARLRADEGAGIAEARFYAHLEELGVDNRAAARRLWRLIGSVDAWRGLAERPYSVASVLGWRQTDHLGQRLLAVALGTRDVAGHPDRFAGACDSVVRDLLAEGHTAATPEEFKRRLARKSVPAARALGIGVERRRVVPFRGLLRAPGAAHLEDSVRRHLERLRAATPPFALAADLRILDAVRDAERSTGLRLTDEQRLAVAALLQQRVGLLQGGAGTGKTTIVRVLVRVWKAFGGASVLAAPSGKAALRLSRAAGERAMTIARLLVALGHRRRLAEEGRLARAAAAELPELTERTMLVLDEASMVDLASLHLVLERMPDGSRLLLVGDHGQLPPVGMGQCYHDLVDAGRGVAELTRPLRQGGGNPLLGVAASIREGRVPVLPRFAGAALGVQLEECPPGELASRLRAVGRRLAHDEPGDDILVLAGLRRSVRDINFAETARRQTEGVEGVRLGPFCPWAAVGDPVIMGRNHYRHSLMNGQLGVLAGLDPPAIRWDGDGDAAAVADAYRGDIESAWAITGHRSQGSDAARVVIALDSGTMLTRQWLYTAVTRARLQAVLVGPQEIVAAAVQRLSERTTGFSALLKGGD